MSAGRRGRERHAIYLIPGFFGFANLGRLRYFVHVHDFLRERCAGRGIDARVHVVHTHPTASLPARAALVLETLARTLGRNEVAHLIGHSTGGVDARLATAPGVDLPSDVDVERFAGRVRSVVGVSAPHHGTPLAAALTMRRGQDLLALLSLLTSYALRFGHLPLSALTTAAAPSPACCVRRARTSRCCSSSRPRRWTCSTQSCTTGPACVTAASSRAHGRRAWAPRSPQASTRAPRRSTPSTPPSTAPARRRPPAPPRPPTRCSAAPCTAPSASCRARTPATASCRRAPRCTGA